MGRVETREELFKRVFEFALTREKCAEFEFEDERKIELSYLKNAYEGITEKFDELTQEIASHTKGYSIDRVFKVDLALLLVAVYEIKYENEIPPAVSINEALNLAKKYSTDKSSSFINGVLANFVKK